MYMFNLAFNVCDTEGFLRVVYFLKLAMNILRFVVPIILIIMITIDLYKNTISPKNKDGMKKITNRLMAAVIVFLVPTFINIFMEITAYFFEDSESYQNKTNYKLSNCYTNANLDCVNKINDYLMCKDVPEEEVKDCQKYRQCNNYTLENNCLITTELNEQNCSTFNQDSKYAKFFVNNYKMPVRK